MIWKGQRAFLLNILKSPKTPKDKVDGTTKIATIKNMEAEVYIQDSKKIENVDADLLAYLNENGVQTNVIDAIEYISHILNKTITEIYEYIAVKSPLLWKMMYKSSNKKIINE